MIRIRSHLLVLCAALYVACGIIPGRLVGEEPYLPFLNALRKAGYGESAVDYIEQIRDRQNLPVPLREVLDLELAKCLVVAAAETEHRDVAEQRLVSAKGFLDKFLREHGEHDMAASAFISLADLETQRGRSLLRQARLQKDNAAKDPLLVQARGAFEVALPNSASGVDRYGKRLTRLVAEKSGNKKLAKRDEEALRDAELDWLESRGKVALLHYYQAQTYLDPNDKGRKDSLVKAGTLLDDIYQRERSKDDGLTATGLYAHMWHGKVEEELGDLTTALDIYEEVLANAPNKDTRQAATSPMGPLFAQVEYFRLLILIKNKSLDEFIGEARDWLSSHDRSEKTNGYQGIALELARALGAKAESAKGEDARKLKREALSMLAKMVDVPSEFQQDALVLRRLMGDNKEAIATYKEAVAIAQAALESNQLVEAIDYYKQGIELAKKEQKLEPENVVTTRLRLANTQWTAGKLDDASQTAEAIMKECVTSPSAPAAAYIAINTAKAKYFSENDPAAKKVALDRLIGIADYTTQKWPDRAEADDARIALGQASMVRGEWDAARKAFETVKPESVRYPHALQQAGQVNWQMYWHEKAKPIAQRDAKQLTTLREKAEQQLVQALESQKKALRSDETPPQSIHDVELVLAEIALEADKPAVAAQFLEPLIAANKQVSTAGLDRTKLRMFLAGVRAFVAQQEFDKAAAVAAILIESGEDSNVVNQVLVDFARMLGAELKRNQAQAITTASGTDPQTKERAKTAAQNIQALFVKVIDQLASRQRHTVPNLIYLAETSAEIGSTAKAREQFQIILKKATDEKGTVSSDAETRIRAKLIGLLRDEKKFSEALPEVDKLISATGGRALEPLVEKGNLLQAQAESSPYDAKLYDAAISYWTTLRLRMQKMTPKPPEYYQLIYNTALCVMVQAEHKKDKSQAVQVVQLLNSVLQLNRNQLQPDAAAKYDALVARAKKLQGQTAPPVRAVTTPAKKT